MHDYLIKTNSLFDLNLPQRSDAIEVKAITKLPENDAGSYTYAPGFWHIVSIDDSYKLPEVLMPFVKASGKRESGLNLPDGIISLSTVWAGMIIRS